MAENLTKDTFLQKVFNYEQNKEWKFEGELPCVIDFWAPWCGPCRAVAPVIEELSKEYAGKVNFYKINTDEEQELAGAFGIRSIPSLLFVRSPSKGIAQAGGRNRAARRRGEFVNASPVFVNAPASLRCRGVLFLLKF